MPGGPVASQEAIKELGTNGGGFYNANSAHPFENPTPLTNLVEIFLLLVIPVALTRTLRDHGRQRPPGVRRAGRDDGAVGRASLVGTTLLELHAPGTASTLAGGAMEGKETRFGEAASSLFATSTTGTSTGAVNSAHSSYSALSGGLLLFNMGLGEVAPGGVGSGLYGMLVLAMLTVFVAGLMVGRTPEYLRKRIGVPEMKLVSLVPSSSCPSRS